MVKSSVVVKFVNTCHPIKRDRLLKGNMKDLKEGENPFHNSIIDYYENRPTDDSDSEDLLKHFDIKSWSSMCLADFCSCFDILYGSQKSNKELKYNEWNLLNDMGRIKMRSKRAILRYYLKYEQELELKRGKLILFLPFRKEIKEIHQKDIEALYELNLTTIIENQSKYEFKFDGKSMAEILMDLEENLNENVDLEDDMEENFMETTTIEEMEDFEKDIKKWQQEGSKGLASLKQFTDVLHVEEHRKLISGLNFQQRKIHDDLVEREISNDEDKEPFHVFIAGKAGTGKSYLTKAIMESFKLVNRKSGNDLSKPSILCICPTANAAYIVGGKTIDSALQFQGSNYTYHKLSSERETDLKFKYDNVSTIFIDEISMVGSGKLAKINFRFQDLADGKDKKLFMGGKSSVVTGDLFQLCPVLDKYVFMHTNLDDRPKFAPSHWDQNYKICFLEEKMRSKGDNAFGELCDRIARNELTDDDLETLQSMVRDSPNEQSNDMFKKGKISIIVTTNVKRQSINTEKLENLLPHEETIRNTCKDKCTNIIDGPLPPEDLSYTKAKGLPFQLQLKVDAPILLTTNDVKYKDDGICNGTKGYIDSFQYDENNPDQLKAIWVVFRDPNVGRRLKMDKYQMGTCHKPNNKEAVPIELTKARFKINQGNHKYVRSQFPMILGYAITTHKSQGDSLKEVIIDFEPGENERKSFITDGSFYVAITRSSKASNVYLKSWKPSYIKVNRNIAKKIDDMRLSKPYHFMKIFNDQEIFMKGKEVKIGYLNCNGILEAGHSEYLNHDQNLLQLNILVIAETKLTENVEDKFLEEKLTEYSILRRFDISDDKKHMGFLIMKPREAKDVPLKHIAEFKDTSCQVMIYEIKNDVKFAFVYLRPNAGNKDQISKILKNYQCSDVNVIMGDLNLNPRISFENDRLKQLCENKEPALNEVTTVHKNQLDHIIVSKELKGHVFVTSFFNFISDHKSIVIRIGENELKDEVVQSLNLRSQKYMKEECKVEENPAKECVKIRTSEVSEECQTQDPYESLEGDNWLGDSVINAYGNLVQESLDDIFVFSSFFYITLRNDPERAKRQTRGTNIFRKKYVFFPIHDINHWYLVIVDTANDCIESVDPLVYKTPLSKKQARSKQS